MNDENTKVSETTTGEVYKLRSGFGEWLPIETAPRGIDNEFLGWDGLSIDKTWEGWDEGGVAIYVRSDCLSWRPTHWMHMPEAPNV